MPSDGAGGLGLGACPESHAPATIAEHTERELIARIEARLPPAPPWMLVGIGDDAAVVEPERNRVEVLTVDAIVEGVHFDRAFVPPDAIGHRALAVNLSDLAAMGAAPRLALLSMMLPDTLPLADFDGIVAGVTSLAAHHRLHIAGGNLTRSPGPLVIDVTMAGTVKRRQALTRSGARPGDEIYVSGTIGAAAAGLQLLRRLNSQQSEVMNSQQSAVSSQRGDLPTADCRLTRESALPTADCRLTRESALPTDDRRLTRESALPTADCRLLDSVLTTADRRLTTADRRLIEAYTHPDPRVRLGVWLGRNRAASACVDLSDGLADGVHRIAEASGVGITIATEAIPIDPAGRHVLGRDDKDAMLGAITGGDDYELLFAVRPRMRRHVIDAARHAGVPLTRIGVCTEDRAVLLRAADRDMPLPSGYTHFRQM